ncbi:hypothetical protein PHSY_004030 [Pseudozyma hubeiensis SY62]|uniref:Bromo domain-containing protein n=1 Tax=Pseudozyma hubeiensis (strain SY62) TaxID=1305764 RepID=R9PED5_PSEHS|nr:hypothetical protein PHSY_004030 [Pseudozyma hubeiensis SY62]GAC96450.1 hypothetical protein PHSY_004030 [Pseudozyma hubeiensis SY62]
MQYSVSAPAAAVASSSTSQPLPRKAVMLKGPSLTSKTFFIPLPSTLDQLVSKAVQLFPVPPGKVPHITLGADERAIVLEESYDFIRDRELLHFRWSAETPRRNLANRVRWDQPSTPSNPANLFPTTASPQSSTPSSDSLPTPASVVISPEALKAQVQDSSASKRDLASATRANTIANRDPNTQLGEGVAARKAHAQRVLAEQQRKREEQHSADTLGAAPIIADSDQDVAVDADPEATAKAAIQLAVTSTGLVSALDSAPEVATEEVSSAQTQEADATITEADPEATTVYTTNDTSDAVSPAVEVTAAEALLAPASVEMTINSPPRKKHVDNGGLDTPPSSGSRSSSPYHSSDRAHGGNRSLDHRMHVEADDEPSSSPISSPTRDVSSRHRNALPAMTMSELGRLAAEEEQDPEEPQSTSDSAASALAATVIGSADDEANIPMPAEQEIVAPPEESAATTANTETATVAAVPKPTLDSASDRELKRIYAFLSNLVSQLLSHKANLAFQRPMGIEFEQFSARSSRPVDLFTIRDNLAARTYGSQHLEGRMAANAVVTDFEDDLTLLYTNARRFFGVRSTQAECVEHLEKFSRSFLNEWKRTQGSAAQSKPAASQNSMYIYRSPGSRSEKHTASPFPMLLTPGSMVAHNSSASSSGKKTVGVNGQPLTNTIGLMRRPDFGFKRNPSYEASSTAAKRPAQPTRTTSEAFERAIRAATSTPQSERVKARQEVPAPFATRSVIETDFMARPPPSQQQQQQAEVSPTTATRTPTTGSKRKLSEATLDEREVGATRSPSVSPPPSPSPTKRNRQPVMTLKSSKSANRRNNKKKARQAAAAAAAAAAAVELAEQKRGKKASAREREEEQLVVELINPVQRPAKRTRASRGASASVESQQATPQAKGKGKGKSSKSIAGDADMGLELEIPVTPQTPSGRTLRSRRTSTSNGGEGGVPGPVTPPRSARKGKGVLDTAEDISAAVMESMDVDGFEVTGSRRRSSRQRKPVNLD